MIATPAPLLFECVAAQAASISEGQGAVGNWASDVATQPIGATGREPVEASRVALDARGGAVVVQWSLSYDAVVSTRSQPGQHYPVARIRVSAALERNGLEIARWTLGEDEATGRKDATVRARLTGTASAQFVDRTSAPGPRTYVLKVWNERASGYATPQVTVGTRTMIVEER
jgi:hypothetical protein